VDGDLDLDADDDVDDQDPGDVDGIFDPGNIGGQEIADYALVDERDYDDGVLLNAIFRNDLAAVRAFMDVVPAPALHDKRLEYLDSGLHWACAHDRAEALALLLEYPGVDPDTVVNLRGNLVGTPLLIVPKGSRACRELLLARPDVDVNRRSGGNTALISACFWNDVVGVALLIAMRGRDLDVNLCVKDHFRFGDCNAIAVCLHSGNYVLFAMLQEFRDHPNAVIMRMRLELGFAVADAATLYAIVIFLCDDFLTAECLPDEHPCFRFFRMMQRLPMQLQMIVCHRAFRSPHDSVLHYDLEKALRTVTLSMV